MAQYQITVDQDFDTKSCKNFTDYFRCWLLFCEQWSSKRPTYKRRRNVEATEPD
jgi:hypothetical protein